MKYLIFFILLLFIVLMYFYYENKLFRLKKQLSLTSTQFRSIRSEYRSSLSKKDGIKINFITPTIKTAITSVSGDVFLAPMYDSIKLNSFTVRMEVTILDSVQIDNEIWYYVSLPIDTTFNCRGWINRKNFSFTYSSSKDIISIKKDIG